MREPEIEDGKVVWGMVEYLPNTHRIRFIAGDIPHEDHEWDQLTEELQAAIRYARKVERAT